MGPIKEAAGKDCAAADGTFHRDQGGGVKIWLAQLKCPQGHCIVAAPFQGEPLTLAKLNELFEPFFGAKVINKHCGICGSPVLSWDQEELKNVTMEEALIKLRELERQNLLTRSYLDAHGLTHDAQERKRRN